jgi:hypothetical protein
MTSSARMMEEFFAEYKANLFAESADMEQNPGQKRKNEKKLDTFLREREDMYNLLWASMYGRLSEISCAGIADRILAMCVDNYKPKFNTSK